MQFCNSVNNCVYNEISQDNVDNVIFKSTNHALDADFIELFDFTMSNFDIKFKKDTCIELENEVVFKTYKNKYVNNYENIIPEIKIY